MESPIQKRIEYEVKDLSQAQILDLAAYLIELAKKRGHTELDQLAVHGLLDPRTDAVAFQRAVRDEWPQ